MSLSLHPIMFLADGSISDPSRPGPHVIQYDVIGLPPKRNALIGKRDGRWQILRVQENVPDAWTGSYDSAEAALTALAAELSA
jgi:hypothetical protein